MKKHYLSIAILIVCTIFAFVGCNRETSKTTVVPEKQSAEFVVKKAKNVELQNAEKPIPTSSSEQVEPSPSTEPETSKAIKNLEGKTTDPTIKKTKQKETVKETVSVKPTPSVKSTQQPKSEPSAKPSNSPATIQSEKPKVTAPINTLAPTKAPEVQDDAKVDPGIVKKVSSGYCKSVLNEINAIRQSNGVSAASWDGDLGNKAQNWADSLVAQSIKKGKYTHYHDDNRDSSEGIFWITDGKTSAKTIAKEVQKHCPACLETAESIGIGGSIWQDCPIGEDMGFIVIRYYS